MIVKLIIKFLISYGRFILYSFLYEVYNTERHRLLTESGNLNNLRLSAHYKYIMGKVNKYGRD